MPVRNIAIPLSRVTNPPPPPHLRSSYISILIFTSSIIPSAMSNVYKESKMKARDLDVYLTTTMISVWQEILGFAFLPLLSLKAMGGMGKDEVWR